MKKIIVILLILLLTGCSSEEVTVKNPNGKSLTYWYFNEKEGNTYNLELKDGTSNIIIKKQDENIYYEVLDSGLIIIEKDGIRYTLDVMNKTYSASSIIQQIDYTEGILPTEDLKDKSYKTGEDKINSFKYTYETYDFDDFQTTYYFDDENLKFIRKKSSTEDFLYEIIKFNKKVSENDFEIPEDYEGMTY